jgi:hypothetical protein
MPAATAVGNTAAAVWKPHLVLRRFASDDPDLKPGARRNHTEFPDDVRADMAPNGRATCHVCRKLVPKGALRVRLMLQCHMGYKNVAYVHAGCLHAHPEARKLKAGGLGDFAGLAALSASQRSELERALEKLPPAGDGGGGGDAASGGPKAAQSKRKLAGRAAAVAATTKEEPKQTQAAWAAATGDDDHDDDATAAASTKNTPKQQQKQKHQVKQEDDEPTTKKTRTKSTKKSTK